MKDNNSLAQQYMELQISFGICTKIQKNADIRKDKKRYRSNIKTIMLAKRNRNNRGRIMSRPYTYVGKYTT